MESILSFLYRYGLVSVCFIILIEYACFPLSSEVILPFSGVIARVNDIDMMFLIVLSTICGIIGSSLCYIIGYAFGIQIIRWLEKKVHGAKNAIEKSYNFFEKYGKYAVFFGRVIPICRTYISFVAGALRQSYIQFVWFSFGGILIWNAVLISLGYVLGENWSFVTEIYDNYKKVIVMVAAAVLFLIVAVNLYKKINNFKDKNGR